jgi:hypothetical protein
MRDQYDEIFGRITERGHISLHYSADGLAVTRLDAPGIYPIGSNRGCRYEHASGIVLTHYDAELLRIEIEE